MSSGPTSWVFSLGSHTGPVLRRDLCLVECTFVATMKLLILSEQWGPHFQFALGPAHDVLSVPTLHTQACTHTHAHTSIHTRTHTTILQMTLDAQESHESIQRLQKDPFSFPLLPGRWCLYACVCVCRCVYVCTCGRWSGGTMCPGREPRTRWRGWHGSSHSL